MYKHLMLKQAHFPFLFRLHGICQNPNYFWKWQDKDKSWLVRIKSYYEKLWMSFCRRGKRETILLGHINTFLNEKLWNFSRTYFRVNLCLYVWICSLSFPVFCGTLKLFFVLVRNSWRKVLPLKGLSDFILWSRMKS